MAGFFPDVPAARIPYDRDGSSAYQVVESTGAIVSTASAAQMKALNNEGTDGWVSIGNGQSLILFFAQPMTISHHFIDTFGGGTPTIKYSLDATNPSDGTWTLWGNLSPGGSGSAYRTAIRNLGTVSGVKAVRLVMASGPSSPTMFHIYGTPTASSDRLELWHPTLDQPLSQTPAWLDYGDVPRTTVVTKSFRIKNLSSTLTASTITVGAEAPTDTSPTYVSQTEFSYNGGAYGATAALPSLAATSISQVFTSRLTTSASTVVGPWCQRYYATAASWA